MSIRNNPIAYLALFIALGGTSYAAMSVSANSVGTRQLQNGAVTNVRVREHSLRASALAPGVVRATSPLTTKLITGAYGPPSCGTNGCPTPSVGTSISYNANRPAGSQVVGGGFTTWYPQSATVSGSKPIANGQGEPPAGPSGGWQATFTVTQQNEQQIDGLGTVYAVCASFS